MSYSIDALVEMEKMYLKKLYKIKEENLKKESSISSESEIKDFENKKAELQSDIHIQEEIFDFLKTYKCKYNSVKFQEYMEGKKKVRLTKERFDTDYNKLTLQDMIINSCDYDAAGNLIFWHLTDFDNATDLVARLYVDFDAMTQWDEKMTNDDIRNILRENLVNGLDTPDGLLANFYWLIDTNAKLRNRLREYEDKEFGKDSYYNLLQ